MIRSHPKLGAQLKNKLQNWSEELDSPGLPKGPLNGQVKRWYEHFMNKDQIFTSKAQDIL